MIDESSNTTAIKLKQLSQKISSLSINHQKQQHSKLQSIQQHIKKLEDEFSKERPLQQSKLQLLKDQINRSGEVIKSETLRIGSKFSNIQQKISTLKDSMHTHIESQKSKQLSQKTSRADINNNELMSLCEMIQKQQSLLYDKFEQNYQNVNMKVNVLKQQLYNEQSQRQNNVIRISDSMQSQLQRFKQCIQIQARQRQQSENKIKMMIVQIRGKLQNQVEKQVKRRVDCNNLMLQLLQTACQKMQKRSR